MLLCLKIKINTQKFINNNNKLQKLHWNSKNSEKYWKNMANVSENNQFSIETSVDFCIEIIIYKIKQANILNLKNHSLKQGLTANVHGFVHKCPKN